jgi:hypothetical protein
MTLGVFQTLSRDGMRRLLKLFSANELSFEQRDRVTQYANMHPLGDSNAVDQASV